MKLSIITLALILSSLVTLSAAPEVKVAETGKKAPEISASLWLDGKTHRIKDNIGKKLTVLFLFGADQPGVMAMPKMNSISRRSDRNQVAFLAVGYGKAEDLKRLPGVQQLPFPVCADSKGVVSQAYLRKFDKLPIAAVIGKDGILCWRGSIQVVPAVLRQILSGKYDIKEKIRVENFSQQLRTLTQNKEYAQALALVRKEWERKPANLELLALQMNFLKKYLNRSEECFKLIKEAHAKVPGRREIFELELQLINTTQKRRKELTADFIARIQRAFINKPMDMLFFAEKFSALKPQDFDPAAVAGIFRYGWKYGKFAKKDDKALFAINYAKVMHHYGRSDLAVKLAAEAEKLFTNPQAKNNAAQAKLYYSKILEVSKSLTI